MAAAWHQACCPQHHICVQDAIFTVVAAVLHLGNATFVANPNDDAACLLENDFAKQHLIWAAELLQARLPLGCRCERMAVLLQVVLCDCLLSGLHIGDICLFFWVTHRQACVPCRKHVGEGQGTESRACKHNSICERTVPNQLTRASFLVLC